MDDILAKLSTINELHGILILLKPKARLTVMFKFCLKELLSRLHRGSAKNIVFGFTNARNTSFRPGETYSTLKSMLEEDKPVGIQLSRSITYCFDSKSFRGLAAHENGINVNDLGDVQDYKLSWQKSADEVQRMIQHLLPSTTKPHRTAGTVDLHATRQMVKTLTIPMADITQTINNNIALQNDEQANVTDAIARGQVLESALHLICSDKACVVFKNNEKHHKSLYHDPCSLRKVQVDNIQCPDLVNCAAFSGSQNCSVCSHSWQMHLHVLWEPTESTVQVKDDMVARRIEENESHIEVMETALRSRQERIKKYERERDILQKAAGQFVVFLKNSSIKPYNDSKLEYLDHLSEEEQGKVQSGGSRQRLDDINSDRRQHLAETNTLVEYSKAGEAHKLLDQEGINNLVQELFALELNGEDLQNAANQLQDIQRSTAEQAKASAVHALAKPRKLNPRPPPPPVTQRVPIAKKGSQVGCYEKLESQQKEQQRQEQTGGHRPITRGRSRGRFADMRAYVWNKSFGQWL